MVTKNKVTFNVRVKVRVHLGLTDLLAFPIEGVKVR